MLIFFVPPAVRQFYFIFKDIFKDQKFSYTDACALLVCYLFGCSSLSDLARRCPWSPSVSTLSLYAARFQPNRFMRRNRDRILKKLESFGHNDFCFALDDTANPKYGSVFGSELFGSSDGVYFGQKILVLVIVDLRTRIAYPISYVFLTSKKNPQHIPAHQRAVGLISEALNDGFPPLPVTSDSWFDSKEFIKAVKGLGCEFAGELKSNRLARKNSNSGSLSQKIKFYFKDLKRKRLSQTRAQKRKEKRGKVFSEMTLFIKDLYIPLKIIAVYNRINGATPFAIYATTDPSMTGARLWILSRGRWAIEVLFRELKQSLGFGGLTAGGEGGAHLSVCIPLILLTSIRLDTSETWASQGRQTLGTIVQTQRELALNKSIELMIHNPTSSRLSRLMARRKNPNQKPTNLSGIKKCA